LVSIAVSSTAGISVPCVTVVPGLAIACARAGAPPTPPTRLAKSPGELPAVTALSPPAGAPVSPGASVDGEALESNTTVGLA